MLAFLLAFVTGVAQMLALNAVLKSALAGKLKRCVLLIAAKLALYAAVLAVTALFLRDNYIEAATGFCIGLPGAAFTFTTAAIIKNKKKRTAKGVDELEHGADN